MQFKIDENLHSDAGELLRQHGHDALTVYDQGCEVEMTRTLPPFANRSSGRSSRWIWILQTSTSSRPKTSTESSYCD
jgi:hypothetical protein